MRKDEDGLSFAECRTQNSCSSSVRLGQQKPLSTLKTFPRQAIDLAVPISDADGVAAVKEARQRPVGHATT